MDSQHEYHLLQTVPEQRCGSHDEHDPHTWVEVIKRVDTTFTDYRCPGREVPLVPVQRKICKDFDTICLEGGCGYCDSGRWRKIDLIEKQLRREKSSEPVIRAFFWGKARDFCNADVRYDDGSTKHSMRSLTP